MSVSDGYSAPVFGNAAGTQIDITNRSGKRTTISQTDPSEELWQEVIAGACGAVGAFIPVAPSMTQLRAAANAACQSELAKMKTYTSGGQSLICDATDKTLSALQRKASWGASNPSETAAWTQDDGSVVSLSGAAYVAIYDDASQREQRVYATLGQVMNSITSGQINSLDSISRVAWPE